MSAVAFDVNQNVMSSKPPKATPPSPPAEQDDQVKDDVKPPTTAETRRRSKVPLVVLNGLRRIGVDVSSADEWISPPPQGTSQAERETSRDPSAGVVFRLSSGHLLIDLAGDRAALDRYVAVNRLLRGQRVRTPKLLAVNRRAGQLLARAVPTDAPLMNGLKAETADRYLGYCLTVLYQLVQIPVAALPPPTGACPTLDRDGLLNGMNLFVQWYLPLKKVELSAAESSRLAQLMLTLAAHIAGRPYCLTHGDFRRAALVPRRGGGVVLTGLERAVRGPLCYDLATLLTDRRLGVSRHRAEQAVVAFQRHAVRRCYGDDDDLCTPPATSASGGGSLQQLVDYTALQICLTRMGQLARRVLINGGRCASASDAVGAELVWYKRCVAQLVAAWPPLHDYADVFRHKFHAL